MIHLATLSKTENVVSLLDYYFTINDKEYREQEYSEEEIVKAVVKKIEDVGVSDCRILDHFTITLLGTVPMWFFDILHLRYISFLPCETDGALTRKILAAANNFLSVDAAFHIPEVNQIYGEKDRLNDMETAYAIAKLFSRRINDSKGMETFNMIPIGINRTFVMTLSMKAVIEFLTSERLPIPELEKFAQLLYDHFQEWFPELAETIEIED